MERVAFARALEFLKFHSIAKWGAVVAGIGTAVLFVALLMVLALFADLVVYRGEIPCFANLPYYESQAFLAEQANGNASDEASTLKSEIMNLGIDPARGTLLTVSDAGRLNSADQSLRQSLNWYLRLPRRIEEDVGSEAAQQVRAALADKFKDQGLEAGVNQNLADFGVLSLVVRTRSRLIGSLVAPLARLNHWMWLDGNRAYLIGLFLLALALSCVRALLFFLSQYLAARATVNATWRLRRAIHNHAYRLGSLVVRTLGPSEAVSVATRHLESVHEGLYVWLTIVFREPVKFGLLLLFALLVNFWLAVAFFLFAVLVWIVGGQIASYFRRQGRLAGQRASEQLALLQENLLLMRLVKVYLMEQFNQNRLERQARRYADAQLLRYRGEALYLPIFIVLAMLATLFLLFMAGTVVLQGQLGVTSAIILIVALISLYWPTVAILDHLRLLRRARQSAVALWEFLDRPSTAGQIADAEFLPGMNKSLELSNVSLKEPGSNRKLLHDINLTIQAGQRVAFFGPDDMEKYALVYLIPRFLDPNSGEIRIDKKNLRWVTLDSLRTQIAVVLQHNLVFNDTVANNIGCGDPAYGLPRIIEAAKMAHAHQFIQKLPNGYETVIGELGHSLPVGEQFRVGLARAILRDPALVIIEEPLSPMAEETKDVLDDTFSRFLPGRTVIFLPHRLSTIRSCDRIFVLSQGRVVAAGDHRELLASSDLYRHLQYLEFNEFAAVPSGA